MAVTYESVSTTNWSGVDAGNNITVNKPTGLSVGDLMVAHIAVADEDSSDGAVSPPGDWTHLNSQVRSDANGMCGTRVYYRVATSADVAASNFTFVNSSGEGMGMAGAIYRISGSANLLLFSGADTGAATSPTFTNTITPSNSESSLLLFLYSGTDSGVASTVSDYAITTSNPTWTERYDQTNDLSGYFGAGNGSTPLMSGATASRSELTATGNSTCTISNDYNYNIGVIVAIQSPLNATVNPSVIPSILTSVSPVITVTCFPTISSNSITINTPTVISQIDSDWVNQDKSSAGTWVTQNKS